MTLANFLIKFANQSEAILPALNLMNHELPKNGA